ncbi:MAG: NHLP bacteriocin system secretion protein [Leptolyngbyaceae cyanobacterium bins.302]|nr:NHLP bacteriocin system secretion protein [Leptolyngbyaceae cyanobacterium bins.302]
MVVQIENQSVSLSNSTSKQNQKTIKQQLFRQQALEQSASPEQLDLPIQIINSKRWLSLLALGTLVTTGLGWSVFGRIPITVTGKGVLTYPSQIKNVQSPGTGRVAKVAVKVGDRVTKGQSLATLDQSELKQQLELARNQLNQLQAQDQAAKLAQLQRENLERTAIAKQRQTIQQDLQTVQPMTPELNTRGVDAIQQERRLLQERLVKLRQQAIEYDKIWNRLSELASTGGYPQNSLIKDKQEYLVKPQTDILAVEAQLKQLDAKEATARQEYLKNVNKVNELQAQLQELESKSASTAEQDLAASTQRLKEIQETKDAIAQLELQLQQSTQIVSEFEGYVRELNISPGQRIDAGDAVGVVAANQPNSQLEGVTFLPVEEGKKLDEAKVKRGVKVQITPTIVKREEYGGIWGEVTKVSQAAITQEGAVHLVGNPAVLPTLMEQGKAYIVVFSKLEPNADTGKYRWTSSNGPDQAITDGTTTTVNITIEERAPISYVIPLLKSLVQ